MHGARASHHTLMYFRLVGTDSPRRPSHFHWFSLWSQVFAFVPGFRTHLGFRTDTSSKEHRTMISIQQEAQLQMLQYGCFTEKIDDHPCFLPHWRAKGLGSRKIDRFIRDHKECIRDICDTPEIISEWRCRKSYTEGYCESFPGEYNIRRNPAAENPGYC